MKIMSGLDFLELLIILLFLGTIALVTYGAWWTANRLFQGHLSPLLRGATVMLGMGLGFYLAGWVVFKDLGPQYTKRALSPFLAPSVRVIVPKSYSGYVTILFGDALGEMKKEKESPYYAVKVKQDGKAIVAVPPRLGFFWDSMKPITVLTEDEPESSLRALYPWDWSYSRGGASFQGLNAFYVSFYSDTPQRLEHLKLSSDERPQRPNDQESKMIDDYYRMFGAKPKDR